MTEQTENQKQKWSPQQTVTLEPIERELKYRGEKIQVTFSFKGCGPDETMQLIVPEVYRRGRAIVRGTEKFLENPETTDSEAQRYKNDYKGLLEHARKTGEKVQIDLLGTLERKRSKHVSADKAAGALANSGMSEEEILKLVRAARAQKDAE